MKNDKGVQERINRIQDANLKTSKKLAELDKDIRKYSKSTKIANVGASVSAVCLGIGACEAFLLTDKNSLAAFVVALAVVSSAMATRFISKSNNADDKVYELKKKKEEFEFYIRHNNDRLNELLKQDER